MECLKLEKKYFINAELVFSTAFHIGSGMPGDADTDSGILKDLFDKPVLPGSSLKGKFRSDAEKISHAFDMTACLLDTELSGIKCLNGVSDSDYKVLKTEINNAGNKKLQLLEENLCDVCKIFGSKMHASRIFFSDGKINEEKWKGVIYKRDGVVIDRDSETARDGLKYNFEVAPDETFYNFEIEIQNPSEKELKLLKIILLIWNKGFKMGGNTSRGLGSARLENIKIELLDFSDSGALLQFLSTRKLNTISLENLG